ncbi:hypothetical protein ColTof3_13946 [Colletotrichum tofieldiae]|nr:hypothetical protein ColTof3_13946 [Colletotrichum tofieldiae]
MPVSMPVSMSIASLVSMIVSVRMAMPMPSKHNPAPKLLQGEILAGASLLKDSPDPLLGEAVVHDRVRRRQRGVHGAVRQEVENDKHAAGPQPLDDAARRELRVCKVVEPETDAGDVEVAEPAVRVGSGGERRGVRIGRVREVALVGAHLVGA